MIDRLDVHIELDGRTEPVGVAYFVQRRGGPVHTTFAYNADYLAHRAAFAVDPHLPLVSGQQAVDGLPGAFQDCAPDRWGRNLILKRARGTANQRGAAPALNDADFLARVSDFTRQGALRFTLPNNPRFVDDDIHVPKLIALPRLLHAVDRLADDEHNEEAIEALLDAGSGSLGGARPKASVLDDNGQLLLAKFPHRNDEWDVMAWEKTALDLAEDAGIDVPGRRLVGLDGRHILLLERFDRNSERRVPYISAMTLVGGRIGDDYDYADIAANLPDFGSHVAADLVQLFRRTVLNCAIHNTDDHLRNHGFLGERSGWRLSPVFDVNPNPDLKEQRVTSVAAASTVADEPSGLLAFAADCRLDDDHARGAISEIVNVVARWEEVATNNGISSAEQQLFRTMFADRAHALAGVASTPRSGGAQGRRPKGAAGGQFVGNRNGSPRKY